MKHRVLVALAVVALTGCGSYKKDLQTMCDAPSKATIPPGVPPSEQAVAMATYIDDHLQTSEGRATFSGLAAVSPDDRAKLLRTEASKNGITSCALADFYEANTVQKPAP